MDQHHGVSKNVCPRMLLKAQSVADQFMIDGHFRANDHFLKALILTRPHRLILQLKINQRGDQDQVVA